VETKPTSRPLEWVTGRANMAKTYATCMLATETASDSTVRVKLMAILQEEEEEEGEPKQCARVEEKYMTG
jgi:hypothetical protein